MATAAPALRYDPDAWTRRWVRVAAACLLVAFAVPVPYDILVRADRLRAVRVEWRWSIESLAPLTSGWTLARLFDLSPLVIGVALLATNRWARGAARGAAVFLFGLEFWVVPILLTNPVDWSPRRALAFAELVGLSWCLGLATSGLAAASHWRWRYVASGVARLLAPATGIAILLLFRDLPFVFRPVGGAGHPERLRAPPWLGIALAVLFLYADLGIVSLARWSDGFVRLSRWASRFLWLGASTCVGLLLAAWNYPLVERDFVLPFAADAAKVSLLLAGGSLLFPLGLAAALEPWIATSARRESLDETFR